jgi:hypothetical protein
MIPAGSAWDTSSLPIFRDTRVSWCVPELQHAQEILVELTNLLIENLSAPLRFVELEGDAVFAFGT